MPLQAILFFMLGEVMQILKFLDDFMYYPILIVVLAAAAIYFSVRTRFIQIRLFPEALRVLLEKPDD